MRFSGIYTLMQEQSSKFDGHAHVFDVQLPMPANRRYTPMQSALLDTYVDLLRTNGMNGGLLVQPSFLGTDNSYLLKAIRNGNALPDLTLKGVAVVDSNISSTELNQLKNDGVVGIRFNRLGNEEPLDLQQWRAVLAFAARHQWHVEVHCSGDQLPSHLKALLAYDVKVVVDHFGLPDTRKLLDCPGHQAIIDAPIGQVFVKVSAPYRVFSDLSSSAAAQACEPILNNLLAALGPEQLVWGSDWPWTQFEGRHDYSDCLSWAGKRPLEI